MRNLILLLIVLFAGPAFAAESVAVDSYINDIFTQGCSAQNAPFLRFMFAMYGDVICYENGTATLLTKIIGSVNVIAMALMIVLSSWFFLTGIIKTATEGEVLGKSWSTVWMPIRLSAGLMLIMPASAAKGLISVAQGLIFQLILAGSIGANMIWTHAIDDITKDRYTETEIKSKYVGQPAEFATKFNILTCMAAKKESGAAPSFTYGVYLNGNSRNLIKYSSQQLFDERSFSKLHNIHNLAEIRFDTDCGSLKLPWNFPRQSKLSENPTARDIIDSSLASVSVTLTKAYLNDLTSIQRFANAIVKDEGTSTSTDVGTVAGAAHIDYYLDQKRKHLTKPSDTKYVDWQNAFLRQMDRSINTIVPIVAKVNAEAGVKKWAETAKRNSWIYAGRLYTDLPAIENMNQKLLAETIGKSTLPTLKDCNPDDEENKVGWIFTSWACTLEHKVYRGSKIAEVLAADALKNMPLLNSEIAGKYSNSGSFTTYNSSNPDEVTSGALISVARAFTPGTGTTSDLITGLDAANNVDRNSGQRLINSTIDPVTAAKSYGESLAISFTVVRVAGLLVAGVFDLADWTGLGLPNTSAMVIGAYNDIANYLKIGAFVFEYYIPLLPLMTWVAAIFVIFKITAQALVAFPLAVVQMMNPEGEGISGTRMERSWALLGAVFLRPALTVIALFTSIKLSIVTFSFFQTMFWSAIDYQWTYISLIAVPGSYLIALVAITKQSVWIINEMPEVVLNWFSSGVGGAFGSTAQEVGFAGDTRDSGVNQQFRATPNAKETDTDGKDDAKFKKA